MSLHDLFEILGGGVIGFFYGVFMLRKIDAHKARSDEPYPSWKVWVPAVILFFGLGAIGHAQAAAGAFVGALGSNEYHNRRK